MLRACWVLYISKLHLLLWVVWFIFDFLTLLSLYFPYCHLFFSFIWFDECLIFSLINKSFLKSGNDIYYCLFSFLFCLFFPLTTRFLHCIKKIKKILKKKKTTLKFSYIPLFCSKFKYEFYLNSNYFFKTQNDFFF